MPSKKGGCKCAENIFKGGSGVGDLPNKLNQNVGGYNDPIGQMEPARLNMAGGKSSRKSKKRNTKKRKTVKKIRKTKVNKKR